MARVVSICALALAGLLTACGGGAKPAPATAAFSATKNLNAGIAGQALSCAVDGPTNQLIFGKDGTVSGELMNAQAQGSWFARNSGEVEVYVDAGPLAIRDVLRGSGRSWAGRNIRCR